MAALSQVQAEATKEAQRAGIAHTKSKGEASPYRGRAPSFARAQLDTVRDMLGLDSSISAIANATGLSRQTVYRIQADPAGTEMSMAVRSDQVKRENLCLRIFLLLIYPIFIADLTLIFSDLLCHPSQKIPRNE